MAAPPTISQTSLPSQMGPIELTAIRRSDSVFPTKECSIPTPKSKPSSTKKPDPEDGDDQEPDDC